MRRGEEGGMELSSGLSGRDFLWTPRWPVLYLDNHVLAVYKPSGLTVQGASSSDLSLLRLIKLWIKMRFQKPGNAYAGLVHRLDKPVAGVCIFARTSKAAARLTAQFKDRLTFKEYVAVVEGIPRRRSGTFRDYLGWNSKLEKAQIVSREEGKEAVLEYEVMDVHRGRSLLKIVPITGRRHQIRIQLASRGLTVVGDKLYGSFHRFPGNAIALYAVRLTVTHPTRKEPLMIEGPEPEGWPWHEKLNIGKSPDSTAPWLWRDLLKQIPPERVLTKALRTLLPS